MVKVMQNAECLSWRHFFFLKIKKTQAFLGDPENQDPVNLALVAGKFNG